MYESTGALMSRMRSSAASECSSTVRVGSPPLAMNFGGEWHWEILVTASVITTVPMIILFFIGQRSFVEGIATTGSKG
ncbi:hypothetical protein [Ruicaihuangia caeni]|uniref:Carbohydrate ABC transporter permease n=1 Tax=Ruicaihuangia caeni TaxID=3042517 RepID=A0AAW6T6W3_9MICO|nr:hypothetical protein [Klugiella sp. YN-L-19]MDI2097377.1 hypothetical protein [Klugiella sp. YN-L-19]